MRIFRKVKDAWDWNRFGLRLGRVKDVLEKESRMQGYDVKTTLLKGAKAFGVSLLAVAGAAVLGWLSDNAAVAKALNDGGLSPALVAVLVPVIHSLVQMFTNWKKNHDKAAQ
jgi:hypothetical protein